MGYFKNESGNVAGEEGQRDRLTLPPLQRPTFTVGKHFFAFANKIDTPTQIGTFEVI